MVRKLFRRAGSAAIPFSYLLVSVHTFPFQATQPEYLVRHDLAGKRGGNLTLAVNSDPASFNRMLTAMRAHTIVLDRLSADLVHINRTTLELEPSLAKSWETSTGGRTYTIRLRQGLRFSDGSPFTANDVLFTFQVLQDPESGAILADQVQVDGSFPRVTKIDEYTVQMTYQRPVGMGLRSLDSIPILPRSRLLKAYSEGSLSTVWGATVQPGDVTGLGPFRLREYRRGERIVLERNPHYWKRDRSGIALPYLDTITFLIIPDHNSEALRFQAGEIDLLNSLIPESYASLRRSGNQSRFVLRDLGPGLAMDFLWFNLNPPERHPVKSGSDAEKLAIFGRTEFRQAVSMALDRPGIARSIFLGLATPQGGPLSSGNKAWHDPGLRPPVRDIARARALLRQIGLRDSDRDGILEYGRGRRPLEILLLTSRGSTARERVSEVIKSNLLEIGVRVEIQTLLPNELAARFLNSLDYEAILFGLTPTDIAPDLQTDLWYSSGKNHFWSPGQAKPQSSWEGEVDNLITRLVRTLDANERRTTFFRVQALWARELPAIPTVAPNILVAWSKSLRNVVPSVLPPHLVWNAEELVKQPD